MTLTRLRAQGFDLQELSYRLMSCFLIQVHPQRPLPCGPTSWEYCSRQTRGNLIFYDLGASIDLQGAQGHLSEAMAAVVSRDAAALVKSLIDLQVIRPVACKSLVRKTLERLFDYLDEEDITHFHASMASEKLFSRNEDRVIRFNASFVYLVRSSDHARRNLQVAGPRL